MKTHVKILGAIYLGITLLDGVICRGRREQFYSCITTAKRNADNAVLHLNKLFFQPMIKQERGRL